MDKAEAYLLEYKRIFGEDFYLEMQLHPVDEQIKANKGLMELAKKITFPKRFEQLVGTTVQELEQWLRSKRGLVMWGKFTDLGENEFAEDLWNFIEDYDYPVPGDFGRLSSYGEVLRDGKPTVVVIDFGFDKNTSGEHEKKKKMRYAY